MLSLNKSYKNRKVSLTIHCKYKYFDSTVQRAEDRRQKFYFCRLPFAVNVKLNLSIIVHGPEPLKCTNSRDQPRVVRIWSLFEGDSKKLWYQSEIASSFVVLKHWNIAKAPFCMKTRLNFKSAIECIVRSGNFIYEIKIQERSVFNSFIMLDLNIFQKTAT